MKRFDVIVIGGGAAGLMCAVTAGQRGKRVLLLEGSNKIGKKILMSGGGRCNFTNLHCSPEHFLSNNQHYCISALNRYTQWDFISLVEQHAIPYHEKILGQLFCDRSSKDIVNLFATLASAANVTILTQAEISAVEVNKYFIVNCAHGRFESASLVVATGGLSIPKMGASDFGYRLAKQLGHQVLPTRAGLVPFTFSGPFLDFCRQLAGVSTAATLSVPAKAFDESILFTHRGISGPAALQLSNYWQEGQSICVDLCPQESMLEWLSQRKEQSPKSILKSALREILPKAITQKWLFENWSNLVDLPLNQIALSDLRKIAQQLHQWHLNPSGTEGYRTAEVTLGGIDTTELSSKTMQSKIVDDLYFIGEVVDVTGHLGGFNFQWAWSSGHAAAQFV